MSAVVAFKWVVEEEDSDAAVELSRDELWAPCLLQVECANALWAKSRRGELSGGEVFERLAALATVPATLVADHELLEPATRLALALEHPVYDCLYLALAVQQDTYVVTADRRFASAVRGREDHAHRIRLLRELADR